MVNFSLRWWFSRQQILFLVDFGIYHWQSRRILCGASSSKTRAKLAISPGLAFLTLILFLVNFSEHLSYRTSLNGCFYLITHSVYSPTATFYLFQNNVTHNYRLSTFSAYFVDWKQDWAQYFNPLYLNTQEKLEMN